MKFKLNRCERAANFKRSAPRGSRHSMQTSSSILTTVAVIACSLVCSSSARSHWLGHRLADEDEKADAQQLCEFCAQMSSSWAAALLRLLSMSSSTTALQHRAKASFQSRWQTVWLKPATRTTESASASRSSAVPLRAGLTPRAASPNRSDAFFFTFRTETLVTFRTETLAC